MRFFGSPQALRQNKWTSLIAQHLRVGYVGGILLIDGAILLVIVVDLARFAMTDRSLGASVRVAVTTASWNDFRLAVSAFAYLAIALPLLAGVINVLTEAGPRLAGLFGVKQRFVAPLHLAASAVVSASPLLLRGMQFISGPQGDIIDSYDFRPMFPFLLTLIGSVAITVTTAAAIILPEVIGYVVTEDQLPRPWVRYRALLNLADFRSAFYPTKAGPGNFVAGSLAPELGYVARRTAESWTRYQERVPGTNEAAAFLADRVERCRKRVANLLAKRLTSTGLIWFSANTSRAIEVFIESIARPRTVVLSPFEHASEAAVAHWASQAGSETKLVWNPALPEHYALSGATLETFLRGYFSKQLEKETGRNTIVVISEVCYLTGRVLPLNGVIGALPEKCSILVDASHAVGAVEQSEPLTRYNGYVFSAHKWLMSSEPCGVLVLNQARGAKPYDCWQEQGIISTGNARAILAFDAALQFIEEARYGSLVHRGAALRNYFASRIPEKLEIVTGIDCDGLGLIVCVRPRSNASWRVNNLAQHCRVNGHHVHEFKMGKQLWLRLCFPFFVDRRAIDELCLTLNAVAL